jgi:hypothetical protein
MLLLELESFEYSQELLELCRICCILILLSSQFDILKKLATPNLGRFILKIISLPSLIDLMKLATS